MGEEAWRIHVVGEPSLDLLRDFVWPTDDELADKLGIERARWEAPLLVTVHPATLHPEIAAAQADHVIDVLRDFDGLVIITSANRDPGGLAINERLRAFAAERANVSFYESLGWETYASLMRRARAVIGNSSSGLLEAPAFELPVVNIGDRQQGRMRAANVIDADDAPPSIRAALDRALSDEFRARLRGLENPYGNGHTGSTIARVLESIDLASSIRTKHFAENGA
jgi:UDP-hydrolysing UDP-N-acetyl-D-glucosamine 2-epimerase